MGIIIDMRTGETVFESDDAAEVRAKLEELSPLDPDADVHAEDYVPPHYSTNLDAAELESGVQREQELPEPPPDDPDRIYIGEDGAVEAFGDAVIPPNLEAPAED